MRKWQGNLVSGGQCPNPVDSGVVGIKQDQTFYIANLAAVQPVQSEPGRLVHVLQPDQPPRRGREACGSGRALTRTTRKTKAVLTKTAIAPFNNATISNDAQGNGQALVPALETTYSFPQISMRVSAELARHLPPRRETEDPKHQRLLVHGRQHGERAGGHQERWRREGKLQRRH